MATLNVTNLQNVASTVTNMSLIADGTTTLVLNATGTSRTGGIRYNAGTLEIYDGANWVAAGGGGPTAATLAEAAAGTLNTVFSSPLTAVPKDASGMSGAALLPGSAVGYAGTPATGMIRYNNSAPPAYLEYYDGGSWVTVSTGAPPSLSAATLAEAATGVTTAKYSSPETAVPKDASGMTGAAILPSGTSAQQPGTPVAGMTRFNTDANYLEVYDANTTAWRSVAYVPEPATLPPDLNWSGAVAADAYYEVNNFTVATGSTITPNSSITQIVAYGDVAIGDNTTWAYNAVGVRGGGGYFAASDIAQAVGGYGGAPGTPDGFPSIVLGWRAFSPGSGASGNKSTTTPAASTQQGGAAGGIIIIQCCGNVTIGNGNVFNVNGGNPVTITTRSGGGAGGGAGGTVLIQAGGDLVVGTSTFTANGGIGGNGSNASAGSAAYGGGGGGGGYIILGALGTATDGSSKSVSGGAAGTSNASPTLRGGGGGGNAGAGGKGGLPPTAPSAGNAGQVINSYVL